MIENTVLPAAADGIYFFFLLRSDSACAVAPIIC